MKSILRIVTVLTVLYGAYLGAMYGVQDGMIFPGTERAAPQWYEADGIELWEESIDNVKVEAIFAPHPETSSEQPKGLLVFLHGNGGLVDDSLEDIPRLHRLGFNVLIPEYRGYGRSDGSPGEEVIVADALKFIERAAARPDVDEARTVYHGQSLGGGVAASIARQRPPTALVLESTFTSIGDFAPSLGAPSFLVKHPFDTLGFLKGYDGPVLLMHATRDPVVPYEMGEQLAAVGRRVQFEAFEGNHHVLPPPREAERYWALLLEFLGDIAEEPAKR